MGQTADELRIDIETRRESLAGTVDAIEDKVMPSRIIRRRGDAARGWVKKARSQVMGAGDSATSGAHNLAGSVSEAPSDLADRTRGAPLVAGGIAFGIGALLALALPETDQERRVAETIEPQLTAVTEAAKDVGQHALESAKSSAQEAASGLKDSVAEHAEQATGDARAATEKVTDSASS